MVWFMATPFLVIGGATAALQTTRGLVRGIGRLANGEPRAALAEVGGGIVAPVASLVHQVTRLVDDVLRASSLLGDAPDDSPRGLRAG